MSYGAKARIAKLEAQGAPVEALSGYLWVRGGEDIEVAKAARIAAIRAANGAPDTFPVRLTLVSLRRDGAEGQA